MFSKTSKLYEGHLFNISGIANVNFKHRVYFKVMLFETSSTIQISDRCGVGVSHARYSRQRYLCGAESEGRKTRVVRVSGRAALPRSELRNQTTPWPQCHLHPMETFVANPPVPHTKRDQRKILFNLSFILPTFVS